MRENKNLERGLALNIDCTRIIAEKRMNAHKKQYKHDNTILHAT